MAATCVSTTSCDDAGSTDIHESSEESGESSDESVDDGSSERNMRLS